MAETVENRVCNACGADVRPQADFCYNCGKAVSAAKPEINLNAGENSGEPKSQKTDESGANQINPIVAEESVEKLKNADLKSANIREEAKLKSAASLRRRAKSFQPKKIEVVWTEHDSAPNVWFISGAVFLTILAAVILFLALYFK